MTYPVSFPPFTPLGAGPAYEAVHIWLPQLFAETARQGSRFIEGRTFVRCQFEGPAVILPVEGCAFDACNMGDSSGDTRNLLVAPVGSKLVGVIPFRSCTFQECAFYMVSFTGSPEFLSEFEAMVGTAS